MAKIPEVPKPELRSQPISALHRQEFVVEFTRSVFLPRIVAQCPSDLKNWQEDLHTQLTLLKAAFPILQKPELRDVYGTRMRISNSLVWEHDNFQSALQRIDTYHIANRMLNTDRFQENVEGRARAFSNALRQAIEAKMPNVKASQEHYSAQAEKERELDMNEATSEQIESCYLWLPHQVRNLHSLLTEKKSQNPKTGEITRTPVIKSQYLGVIPKTTQTQILKWVNKKRGEVSTDSLQAEMQLMYTFSQELYEGIRVIRNTKQFQERLPDMFDDFCFITGLGQCDGKDLICSTEMSTVSNILAQYKKA